MFPLIAFTDFNSSFNAVEYESTWDWSLDGDNDARLDGEADDERLWVLFGENDVNDALLSDGETGDFVPAITGAAPLPRRIPYVFVPISAITSCLLALLFTLRVYEVYLC